MSDHDDALRRIDEVLGVDPDWDSEPVPPPDEVAADRLLYRWMRERSNRVVTAALYDRQIASLTAARDDHLAAIDDRIDWLTTTLNLWHAARLTEDPHRKTIRLPHGTLSSRRVNDTYDFDPAVFVPWAVEHCPQAVRLPPAPPPTVDRRAAKDTLDIVMVDGRALDRRTGEFVPGVTVRPAHRTYTIQETP
jgi:Bacteriophage Mu Gam like protein